MKVYRNSIYILLIITTIVFCLYQYDISKDILLSVFGSALVALILACISYFAEKEKIIIAIGLKVVSIYTIIWSVKNLILSENINKNTSTKAIENIVRKLSPYKKLLNDQVFTSFLQGFTNILPSHIFNLYINKEILMINSLSTVNTNLINGDIKLIQNIEDIYLKLILAKNDDDTQLKDQYTQQLINLFNYLTALISQQLDFLEPFIKQLFKYGYFAKPWSEMKKDIGQMEQN